MGKPKIHCASCQKKCSGEVLRVTDKYFCKNCFSCTKCTKSLATGGFFVKENNYYCVGCYQQTFGTKCAICQKYVEGEVVSTMGNTYCKKCFTCNKCNKTFESGSKVTNTGKEIICEKCVDGGENDIMRQKTIQQQQSSPTKATAQQQKVNGTMQNGTNPGDCDPNNCAACNTELKEGQALFALDRYWHLWCFRCTMCGQVLSGEYMGKEGKPYCEKCYQKSFGVKCGYCMRYISGKVLQAGDFYYHPTCARCSKCGDPFGDGEEMYIQGTAIWHPRCGPGPSENGGISILNGTPNGDIDRISNSAMSEIQFSLRSRTPSINGSVYDPYNGRRYHRTTSPGLILREYNHSNGEDISRIYTHSYLTETTGGLKRPVDPYDKKPVTPQFHRPNYTITGRPPSRPQSRSRSAMRVLVDSIRTETPRPKTPSMNNEEPIELSHYPGGKKPQPGETSKIDRDDFPAPPYAYTDPERRRKYTNSYKGVNSDDEDQVDNVELENIAPQLKREEEELKKIDSGMGKVLLKDVKERQKYKIWKQNHLDPRNASRTPSASREPVYKMRFESSVGASPSRNLDHSRPYEDEYFDRSMTYRGSVGRTLNGGNSYNAINSYRSPKSSYKHSTLPTTFRNGYSSDFSFGPLVDKTHSTDFSCGKSDTESITDGDRRALGADIPASSTYSGAIYNQYPNSGLVRRSLPNVAHSVLVHEPAKIYPYHLLLVSNYRLPADVDRCNLERHLADMEFEAICGCTRSEFYRMPQWKRNDIKRRARLY